MSKPVYGYWNIRGFGHAIRLLLAYLEVDYEEKFYIDEPEKRQVWFDEKFKLGLDFPNLPYWIDDKVKITESTAIITYLCRKYSPKMIPGASDLWKAEMLDPVITDIWRFLVNVAYRPSEAVEQAYNTDRLQKFEYLQNFKGSKKFFLGDEPCYVDFRAYEMLAHYVIYNATSLDKYDNLKSFMKNFEELPAIKKYMANPNYIAKPCFSSGAVNKF